MSFPKKLRRFLLFASFVAVLAGEPVALGVVLVAAAAGSDVWSVAALPVVIALAGVAGAFRSSGVELTSPCSAAGAVVVVGASVDA